MAKYREIQESTRLGFVDHDQYLAFSIKNAKDGGFRNAGYQTFDDYLDDFKSSTRNQFDAEAQQAATYTEAQKEVEQEGFYDIDEYVYRNDMTKWSPRVSQILKAHSQGLTLEQYNYYMSKSTSNDVTTRRSAFDDAKMFKRDADGKVRYTDSDIADMNASDYKHLQADLQAAGYNPLDYDKDFTLNLGINVETFDYDQKKKVRQVQVPTNSVQRAVDDRDSVDAMVQG
jgi:hypothetical protein